MKTIEVKIDKEESESLPKVPTIIKWKNTTMIRNHSINATVREIIQISKSLDVVRIGIIGNQGTGKTTLAKTLAHLIHKIALENEKIPFAVKLFDRNNLLNFQETIRKLSPTNYILIFDDVSFLGANASKKQIEIIKQSITEIRHLEGGQDVKIIIIMNYHYSLGLDKYIRTADFRYFTSIGSSEMDNMEKIVGAKIMPRVIQFKKRCGTALRMNKFYFKLGPKKGFTYEYRKPFIPLLFYNNDTLRNVVSPTKEWIDPICSICENSNKNTIKSNGDAKELIKDITDKFGERIARSAAKIKLFQNGINTYPKTVKQCMSYIDKYLNAKRINLEELSEGLELRDEKTKLNVKLPIMNN